MTRSRRGFTLIELIIVVVILFILGGALLSGGSCIMGGCSTTDQGSLLVNPYHNSTVVFKVLKSYSMASPDGLGNIYRVFAQIIQDSDGNAGGEETFEIRDSWLDGNMMSADLFGRLQDQHIYEVKCRGERSGVMSSFRGIVSLEHVAAPE